MEIINHKLKTNNVLIVPWGDFQMGNPSADEQLVRKHFKGVKDLAKRLDASYVFVGTGDYTDFLSGSNREGYRRSGLYSSAQRVIEDRAVVPLAKDCLKVMEPMKEKTALLLQGHHYMVLNGRGIEDDGDPPRRHYHTDRYLAAMLRTTFAEGSAIVRFVFPNDKTFDVFATHGQGNGQSLSYGLNKLSRFSKNFQVDALVMGHTHKSSSSAEIRIGISPEGKLEEKIIPLVTAGSFLRSYEVGDVNYPEQAMMTPLALGGSCLWVKQARGKGEPKIVVMTMYNN